ncbi:hypothetical protein EIP86_007658 [Pleurotus ostreatoroseus]|nr:hypothetical protein EIP86_007658 [Pleurotus ostreatoroseus]
MASSSATGSSTEENPYEFPQVEDFEFKLLNMPPELMLQRIQARSRHELDTIASYRGSDRTYRRAELAKLLTCSHDKPDIVAKDETAPSDSKRLPWHKVESVVTVVDKRGDINNSATVSTRLLEARPDCPGIYSLAFALKKMEYRIFWTDAAGFATSKWYTADDGWDPLLAYIYSLYRPLRQHMLRDSSIIYDDGGQDVWNRPRWNITCGGQQYLGCKIVHCGDVHERRTTVFEYRNRKNMYVIKDWYWVNGQDRQEEGPVIAAIHKKGTLPGVVRLHHYESVSVKGRRILTPSAKHVLHFSVHERSRMVLASTGAKLVKAKTVKDLLMAVYDILEAHRSLVVSRDILHRDMSYNNILMYPEHARGSGAKLAKDSPTFIATVLGEDSNESKGLIIDFDHATSLRRAERRFRTIADLEQCTGTPRFLARSSSLCAHLRTTRFRPMPVLIGEAKDRYVEAYSQDEYDLYTDNEDTWHGVPRVHKTDVKDINYLHRPDHDVETTFWSMIYASMQLSGPEDQKDDCGHGKHVDESLSDHASFTWSRIHGHAIHFASRCENELPKDSRDVLLVYTEEDWREALHPAVACLAPLFVQMAHQIYPEYGLLETPPPQEHLHEAMRRLLLAHIVSMEDPVPLDPREPRAMPLKFTRIDPDDTSKWRSHWIPPREEELAPPSTSRLKLTLRLPPLPRKRSAEEEAAAEENRDGEKDEDIGKQSKADGKSPRASKRQKRSH